MVKSALPRPEANIGMIGHVDHGKTLLAERKEASNRSSLRFGPRRADVWSRS